MVTQPMHASLAEFLARHSVSKNVRHDDGSVHLVFDKQYRIAFLAAPKGALWLESRVCELPENPAERQLCLNLLLERAANEIFIQTTSLALPQDGNLIIVQQLIPAEAGLQEFIQFLEKFINLLASYRSLAGVL